MMTKRKKRSDRNHVIYCITNLLTKEQYVGLTALSYKGNVMRTLKRRMQKHLQRALSEDKNWGLCENLRKFGAKNFEYGVLEVVRGKLEAHARETYLINNYNPKLNTFKKGS
jgi:group I intron endonuclease